LAGEFLTFAFTLLNSLFVSNKKDEKIRGIAKNLDTLKPIFDLFLIHTNKDNIFYFLNLMVEINKTITLKLIFLISIIALSSAFFIEYILGHQPCNLCILERIPYLMAIIIIVLNYKFIHLEKYFIILLILVFLAATILSLYHLGIEQGFIEESLVCDLKNGSNLLSKEDILKQLQEKNVSCKDVTFKILGLSLTSYNIIISILIVYSTTRAYLSYENNK